MTYFETDTIAVKKRITFQQVSELLDIPVSQIEFLNPIYKLNIIPFEVDKPHYLRLPKNKIGLFVSNEDKVYAYVDYQENLKEKPYQTSLAITNNSASEESDFYHKIRSGESLGLIANKYKTTITNLRKWNNIKGNNIQAGKTLKIYSATSPVVQNTTKASNNGYYTVKSGDSLFSIARQFPGVSVDDLKKWNDISGDAIQPGMKLKTNG